MDLEATARRIKALREQAKALTDEASELAKSLDLSVGNHPAGRYIVQVQEVKRFDAATAKRVLTPELFNAILVPKPDASLAKKMLTGYELDQCKKDYGTKVLINEVKDEDADI